MLDLSPVPAALEKIHIVAAVRSSLGSKNSLNGGQIESDRGILNQPRRDLNRYLENTKTWL